MKNRPDGNYRRNPEELTEYRIGYIIANEGIKTKKDIRIALHMQPYEFERFLMIHNLEVYTRNQVPKCNPPYSCFECPHPDCIANPQSSESRITEAEKEFNDIGRPIDDETGKQKGWHSDIKKSKVTNLENYIKPSEAMRMIGCSRGALTRIMQNHFSNCVRCESGIIMFDKSEVENYVNKEASNHTYGFRRERGHKSEKKLD